MSSEIGVMTVRWQVFRGKQSLGLMSSQEIRQALREGVLDPFDKVMAEGSSVSRQLVECDEIFNLDESSKQPELQSNAQAAGSGHNSRGLGLAQAPINLEPARNYVPRAEQYDQPRLVEAGQEEKNYNHFTEAQFPASYRAEFEATRAKKDTNKSTRSEKDQHVKNFYVTSKEGRVLGPLSPAEVQSLFQRGILQNSDRVQKTGSVRGVTIQQFVATYSGAMIKALANETQSVVVKTKRGKTTVSPGASSRVLNELTKGLNVKKKAQSGFAMRKILMIILGAVIGAGSIGGVFHMLKNSSRQESQRKGYGSKKRMLKKAPIKSGRLVKKPLPKLKKKIVKKPAPKKANRRATKPKARKVYRPPPKQAYKAPPVKKARPKQRQVTKLLPVKPPMKKPQVIQKQLVRKKVAVAPPVKKKPLNLRALDGQVAEIGPMSYSVAELQSCPIKCRLSFRHASGTRVVGVFFKAAYYDLLRGRKTVSIRGQISKEGGGHMMVVQGVR